MLETKHARANLVHVIMRCLALRRIVPKQGVCVENGIVTHCFPNASANDSGSFDPICVSKLVCKERFWRQHFMNNSALTGYIGGCVWCLYSFWKYIINLFFCVRARTHTHTFVERAAAAVIKENNFRTSILPNEWNSRKETYFSNMEGIRRRIVLSILEWITLH